MKKRRMLLSVIAAAGWTAAWAAGELPGAESSNALPRVESVDLYRAGRLELYSKTNDLALERFKKPWTFSASDKCNFTYFSPSAKDIACGNDGLRFKTSGEEVIVGWGNYDNLQPRAERVAMFPGWNDVELDVCQSATASVWRFTLWMDGVSKLDRKRRFEMGSLSLHWASQGAFEARVAGTNRQTIRFRAYRGQPDGFGLRISGPAGNAIAIKQVRVTQVKRSGYFRRVFALPAGRKVWRAVGEAGGARLFVNGREVEFMPELLKSKGDAYTYPVDLAPYLKPGGQHVLALDPAGSALPYFQGRVVFDDGSALILDTGPDWKGAMDSAAGWTEAGFDDAGWSAVITSPAKPPGYHHLDARWPVYDGRVLLENAGKDPQLYFDDAAPIQINARIPGGWAGPRPAARWTLRRVERDNTRPAVGQGQVAPDSARAQAGSLIYPVNAGLREQGVYTIEVELAAGGQVVEHRCEEPLIVVGRLPMKEVAGNSCEEGMELELEDTLDFTKPDDPHRWIELTAPAGLKKGAPGKPVTEPKIVRKHGLVYREVTDAGPVAMFSYRFKFQRPFSWYLMVLEYPNDAERSIGVAVTCANASQCGPSVLTGGKFPLNNKMEELRWVHWADAEAGTLDIVNLGNGAKAAAARARLYRIKDLPALKIATSGERFFGIHTERARSLGQTFGDTSGMDQYQNEYVKRGYDMVAQFTQRLRWQAEAARNYTAYLRFTGQNLHVMGAFQYNEGNTAYTPPERVPGDGRILQDIRDVALRYFERNGVVMYSLVEYIEHKAMRAYFTPSDEDVAAGADTLTFVSREGKQGGWCVNPNHPAAEMGYLRVAEDLAEKFAFSPAWKGIFYNVSGEGTFGPGPNSPARAPFDYDYSDATIARFEKETGIRMPGDPAAPERFELRHLFLTSDAMRETWIDWRGRNMGSHLIKTRDVLRKHRPDLNVLCSWHLTTGPIRFWLADAKGPYGEYARQLGMNPAAVRDEPGIWFGRVLYPVGSSHAGRRSDVWAHNVDPTVIAYYDMPNRMVVLNTCWHELTTRPGAAKDWPVKEHASRFITQASGDYALESFTQAMIGADPDILVFGFTDVNIINSREQQVREVAKAVTVLPQAKFEPVLGTADFKHNLAIRALRQGGAYWFYAANPGYWPIQGQVTLNAKTAVITPCDGKTVATAEENGKTVVPIALKPYGMVAFKAGGQPAGSVTTPDKETSGIQHPASNIEIVSWTNAPLAEDDLAHMRGIIKDVRALLDERETALALPRTERDYLRATCGSAETLLQAGQYAAAWSALTHWRFWELWKQVLGPAKARSARLPGRPAAETAWNPADLPVLQVARVTGSALAPDGKLDDAVWQQARPNFRFLSIGIGSSLQLGYPLMDMAVQAAYDERALYIGLRMADPDVTALKKTAAPENPIEVLRQYDDTVVIFLSLGGNRVRQFAVNAGGVKYFSSSGAWSVGQDDVRKAAWQAATGARAGEWMVEAVIPFAELETKPPGAGDEWRANFVRRFRDFTGVPETYWARVSAWENADQYGKLIFQ